MFGVQNTQASPAARNSNHDIPTAPARKTTASAVNSLARTLLVSSPGQTSINHYLALQRGTGKRPNVVQANWLGLRNFARQMNVVEQQAAQAGRAVSARDRKLAAQRSANYLHALTSSIHEGEKHHPSFRKELIEHLENIVRWHPKAPFVWALAYKSILPGEFIRFKGKVFDQEGCRLTANRMHRQAARAQMAGAGGLVPMPQHNGK